MIIIKNNKKMKTRLFMSMAAAAVILAGCNNEETDNWAGEIRLSSGLTAQQTRSIATDLQGDQIADGIHVGFFINEAVQQSPTTIYPQNLDYTANGSGSFSGTAVYYPQSGNSVNIYAYAPWKDGLALNDTYAFSIRADQSEDADYLASDLLWGQPMKPAAGGGYETANPVARTKKSVSVSFKHLLSKIQVTLIPDLSSGLTAEDFKGARLEILSVLPGVSLALADGGISAATGTPAPVIAATYSKDTTPAALTAAAIVVPQTFTKGSKFMKVTLSTGGELFYTLPDADGNLTLESGKVYTYDITVKLTGLTVTSKIEDWSPIGADPIPGTAEMD